MQPDWSRPSRAFRLALGFLGLVHGANLGRQPDANTGDESQILAEARLYPRTSTTLDPVVEDHVPAAAGQGGVDAHKSQDELRDDYNKETPVAVPWAAESSVPVSVEALIAFVWITMVASLPLIGISLEGTKNITKVQLVQFATMWIVFFSGVYLFTNVLYFQSIHFDTIRRLTVVESVYLLAQILTTVGYGDITPAKPRGQVFVAFYVLFSLLVLANVFSECTELITQRAKETVAAVKKSYNKAKDFAEEAMGIDDDDEDDVKVSAKFFDSGPPPLDFSGLISSVLFYSFFVLTGCLFFHYYPGEGKTWFQGVYMSVITLSTVGFGAFTPVTEGGKVFGAFWMLFGCAGLGAVIGNFTDVFVQIKAREKYKPEVAKMEQKHFFETLPAETDKLTFFKKSLLSKKLVNEETLDEITRFYHHIKPNGGSLSPEDIRRHIRSSC